MRERLFEIVAPTDDDDDYNDGELAIIINEGHPDTDRDPVANICP